MSDYIIDYVMLSGGASVPALKLVCPKCKTLVMGTTVDTESKPWEGHCPKGHSWEIRNEADA